jgi:hypothetical protein
MIKTESQKSDIDVVESLGYTPENAANLRTSFQSVPDDTHYISEKLAKDSLDEKQDVTDEFESSILITELEVLKEILKEIRIIKNHIEIITGENIQENETGERM